VINFIDKYGGATSISINRFLDALSISSNRYYDWKRRYGQSNIAQQTQPKCHWLLAEEREAILHYAQENPREGYRRLSYMMLDDRIVGASPSTVYRVLLSDDMLNEAIGTPSLKGTGFNQPSKPHSQWHSDISYVNIAGTFFYFISALDGYSRYIVHWELRESMTDYDVQLVIQRALEKHPGEHPRIISDNGKQYTSHDFKSFIRSLELTQARTSPYYPQSNGKIERFHRTLKSDGIKHGDLVSLDTARARMGKYIDYYNNERLHSAIDYVAPFDKMMGQEEEVFARRKAFLADAKDDRATTFIQRKNGRDNSDYMGSKNEQKPNQEITTLNS